MSPTRLRERRIGFYPCTGVGGGGVGGSGGDYGCGGCSDEGGGGQAVSNISFDCPLYHSFLIFLIFIMVIIIIATSGACTNSSSSSPTAQYLLADAVQCPACTQYRLLLPCCIAHHYGNM